MYEKEQRGEEFTGQQQRNLVLLFGPTAAGKILMLKKKYMATKKKIYTKKMVEPNGGVVMMVKIMY